MKNRFLLTLFSSSSVLILLFSRVIIFNFLPDLRFYSQYLFYVSSILLIAFCLVMIISIPLKKENKIYNSADSLLLFIPVVLFFLLEFYHFKNTVPKQSIDKISSLLKSANIDISNFNQDSSFIKVYDILHKIENDILLRSGGRYIKNDAIVHGNDIQIPNEIIMSRNFQNLESQIGQLHNSFDNNANKEYLLNLKTTFLNSEIIKDNTVVELITRLKVFELQLKNLELQKYNVQQQLNTKSRVTHPRS
ncbi:hypothetical protein [Flammeovirga agarivorans]|uniref:Uncharacterized protein n=1 Tax=Flammeovirga agarivorans TaxID=2726742 RepID=A0A7X8SRI9_9BACT|nr:hypothetical protein [Flammeovirga agarivorans]NLR95031.1 hypothetical protein [Flammeovirga agarivorans]